MPEYFETLALKIRIVEVSQWLFLKVNTFTMADLIFHSVEGPLAPALSNIQSLYETAFPYEERRDFEDLLAILERPNFHLDEVKDGSAFVGLVAWWQFEGFIFMEHLAIEPPLRGRRYGSRIVAHLKMVDPNLFLEVEFPRDKESNRRVSFYERLGFLVLPYRYAQPA